MKTKLPARINNQSQAESFLMNLIHNNEIYHPEDDAHDIIWHTTIEPSPKEKDHLNSLMDQVYQNCPDFDPCEFINTFYDTTQAGLCMV